MYGADWTAAKVIECLTAALARPLCYGGTGKLGTGGTVDETNAVTAIREVLGRGDLATHLIQRCRCLAKKSDLRETELCREKGWDPRTHREKALQAAEAVANALNLRANRRLSGIGDKKPLDSPPTASAVSGYRARTTGDHDDAA